MIPLSILALAMTTGAHRGAGQGSSRPSCLAFVTTELAKGAGNFYEYVRFSEKQVKIQAGDFLVYRTYLDPKNPSPKGGVDINFTDNGVPLRDMGLTDQNGIRAHGDGILTPAQGKWYERRISLDGAKGRTTGYWDIVEEGDDAGRYVQFLSEVEIVHADGTKTAIYEGGMPLVNAIDDRNGYTENPSLVSVDLSEVTDGVDLATLTSKVVARAERNRKIDEARKDIEVTEKFLRQHPNPAVEAHIREATAMLSAVENKESTTEEIEAVLHAAQHALSHTHPVMEQYTGHLVGHAHIDLQWLWEWQEGIVFSRDTFRQAAKFMDEYPGFSFSQSSSCLYQAMEEDYPEIFKKIQEKVKSGQWEIVGGRVCEGDTNMISPESHARHFLYGQRYFREKFGKTAVVGWEPDTFGHTIQMPQILKLGGCKYYYFCRGGKDKPLFWWQGLDGTKVLAFDEPANGSWYNSDLSYKQFQQMLDFETHTGSKDMLWVYGVGNHGGGPTREYIQTALSWMKDPSKPKVKFSTATQFFKKLETYNLAKIPVVDQELNPVFDGCYTTHSEIKQLNRQAEYTTTSAEAVATLATRMGYSYPGKQFRKNWEDICFNHHHDTLPGSGIHTPYERTKTVLSRVIADDKDIQTRALETMAIRVTPEKGGLTVMVVNPTGWKRSGWVNQYLVTSGFADNDVDAANAVAIGADGSHSEVDLLDPTSKLAKFYATDIPAFGYKLFHIVSQPKPKGHPLSSPFSNQFLDVEFDAKAGTVSRVFDKVAGKEVVASAGSFGRLEIHNESPEGMSAWVLGRITSVNPLKLESSDPANGKFTYSMPASNHPGATTRVTQTFHLVGKKILVDVDCDWQNIGTDHTPEPMLRVAFDSNLQSPKATYEVPFGALERPADGSESAALNWADLSDSQYGVSILNDSKSGHSASGNTLRLSLIRSSFSPDPEPNPGIHHWQYEILPHSGDWRSAGTVKEGIELQEPLLSATIPFDATGTAPKLFSLASLDKTNLVPTGLKIAEDGEDVILRYYESAGTQTQAKIGFGLPITGVGWVNFVEDPLGLARLVGGSVTSELRPFEIQTLKVKMAPKMSF